MSKRSQSTKSRALVRALESRYWKEPEARAVLAAWAGSGESAAVFAKRHGLAASRLLRWKARLSSPVRQPLFHPVKVIGTGGEAADEAAVPGIDGALELILVGGRRIAVRRGFEPETLAELVRVVESWEC